MRRKAELDFIPKTTLRYLRLMRRLHLIKKGVRLSEKEKLSYEMLWISLINKIPKKIRNQIVNLGVSTNTLMGLRDFCLIYLYKVRGLSTYEIAEKYRDFYINKNGSELGYRGISNVVSKYGVRRSHDEALRHRFKTGRVNFSKRKIDYSKIDFHFKEIDARYGYKYAIGLRGALKKARMKVADFAYSLGLNRGTIYEWLNCRARVNSKYQKKVCKILKVKNEDVFSNRKKTIPMMTYYFAPDLNNTLLKRNISIYKLQQLSGVYMSHFRENRRCAFCLRNAKRIALILGFRNWRDLFNVKVKFDSSKNSLWAVALNSHLVKAGKTKQNLARYLGLDFKTISRWANLEKRVDPIDCQLVADYLRVTVNDIFRGDKLIDGLLKLAPEKKEHYRDIKRIYDETGSLAETGRRLNITREAVRQALEKGRALGLY